MNRILFRLPDTQLAHELRCSVGEEIMDIESLGNTSGYVFAPFSLRGKHPALFFRSDNVLSWEIPSFSDAVNIDFTDNSDECYQEYRSVFQQCLQYLQAGTVKKIVLSRTLSLELSREISDADLQQLFTITCQHYPHSYVSLVQVSENCSWLIATPEVLLEDGPDHTWHTMALAATMSVEEASGLSPQDWSSKDVEEQQIVANYIADRLQELQIPISMSPLHTLTAGHLVHLCTDFTLPRTHSLGHLVSILHPTPAVCGHPTREAHRLIEETERHDRAYYAGFSGPVNLSCGTHLFVTLRCMQILGHNACLYAGGGLLSASKCDKEWQETQRKLNTMLHVLQ